MFLCIVCVALTYRFVFFYPLIGLGISGIHWRPIKDAGFRVCFEGAVVVIVAVAVSVAVAAAAGDEEEEDAS